MIKVLCILTNGFEEVEAIGTIGLLRRAGINVDVYSLHNNEATGRFNTTYANLKNINELGANYINDYDCLFIAGGPQYVELANTREFLDIIVSFYKYDKYISAICAGPTILGKLGILKNKNYTCFPSMNENFGGNFIDKYAIADGKIVTGRSAVATIDFALLLIKTIAGEDVEMRVKKETYFLG